MIKNRNQNSGGEAMYHLRVSTDWVETNFLKEVLAIAQRLGYDLAQKYTSGQGKKAETVTGFVSVTNLKVQEEQISQIKYLPRLKTPMWRGLIWLPKQNNKFVYLNDAWLKANVPDTTYNLAKQAAEKGTQGYFRVPAGEWANHNLALDLTSSAPEVYYKQREGESTCVLKSAASALKHLNEVDLANQLFVRTKFESQWANGMVDFRKTIEKASKERGGFEIMRAKKEFNTLVDAKNYWMCLLVLWGSDGKRDHAVAIADGWIFDSNFKMAMEVTKANLDECCSTDDTKCEFAGIADGWLVIRNKSKRGEKRKWRKCVRENT